MKKLFFFILIIFSTILLSSCSAADKTKNEPLNQVDQTRSTITPPNITSTPDSEDQILLDLNTPEPNIDKDLQDLESALK